MVTLRLKHSRADFSVYFSALSESLSCCLSWQMLEEYSREFSNWPGTKTRRDSFLSLGNYTFLNQGTNCFCMHIFMLNIYFKPGKTTERRGCRSGGFHQFGAKPLDDSRRPHGHDPVLHRRREHLHHLGRLESVQCILFLFRDDDNYRLRRHDPQYLRQR